MNLIESRIGLAVADRDTAYIGYQNRDLVAELISAAFRGGGLGQTDTDSPLRDIIDPGMSVLIKPNWVLHFNKSGKGMDCMITHPVFIEEVIRQVAKASPSRIMLADAPIQRTVFSRIVPADWRDRLNSLGSPGRLDVVDFRKSVWCNDGRKSHIVTSSRSQSDYILFDLGAKSLLEPISEPVGRFRNTCYHPDALARTHRPGRHQYVLSREFFEADVVVNLPKLKSHRKAGITAALKNLVGINGDKDFLPHHRIGGSAEGGDCYEGRTFFKHVAEWSLDHANRRINTGAYYIWTKVSEIFMKLNRARYGEDELEGGWYGNDTVWRMILDLNRLAVYGTKEGTISPEPQRRVFSLTDAVTAGEAFGPLAPEPVHLGAVTFASSSAYADLVHTALMRFNWENIPTVKHSFDRFDYPLAASGPEALSIDVNGEIFKFSDLSYIADRWGLSFRPAHGWKGHIELAEK